MPRLLREEDKVAPCPLNSTARPLLAQQTLLQLGVVSRTRVGVERTFTLSQRRRPDKIFLPARLPCQNLSHRHCQRAILLCKR